MAQDRAEYYLVWLDGSIFSQCIFCFIVVSSGRNNCDNGAYVIVTRAALCPPRNFFTAIRTWHTRGIKACIFDMTACPDVNFVIFFVINQLIASHSGRHVCKKKKNKRKKLNCHNDRRYTISFLACVYFLFYDLARQIGIISESTFCRFAIAMFVNSYVDVIASYVE